MRGDLNAGGDTPNRELDELTNGENIVRSYLGD